MSKIFLERNKMVRFQLDNPITIPTEADGLSKKKVANSQLMIGHLL